MECINLTIRGFTQPAVAQPLIELPANAEKVFSSHFLWLFPKTCYSKFSTLEPVSESFTDALGELLLHWPEEITSKFMSLSLTCMYTYLFMYVVHCILGASHLNKHNVLIKLFVQVSVSFFFTQCECSQSYC